MLTIDLDAPEPLHEQIVRGLRNAVASGAVRIGDRLPSVRQLAGDLGVNLNTVARAYRRLEDEGLVRVRHGQGVEVVADRAAQPDRDRATGALDHDLTDALSRACLAGLGPTEVRDAVERAIGRVFAGAAQQDGATPARADASRGAPAPHTGQTPDVVRPLHSPTSFGTAASPGSQLSTHVAASSDTAPSSGASPPAGSPPSPSPASSPGSMPLPGPATPPGPTSSPGPVPRPGPVAPIPGPPRRAELPHVLTYDAASPHAPPPLTAPPLSAPRNPNPPEVRP